MCKHTFQQLYHIKHWFEWQTSQIEANKLLLLIIPKATVKGKYAHLKLITYNFMFTQAFINVDQNG